MPMTVSWATPMALGSRRAAGWGGIPTIAAAGRSVISVPLVPARRASDAPMPASKASRPLPGHPRDHNEHFRREVLCPLVIRPDFALLTIAERSIPHEGTERTIQASYGICAMRPKVAGGRPAVGPGGGHTLCPDGRHTPGPRRPAHPGPGGQRTLCRAG